jgi:hypothetical protein
MLTNEQQQPFTPASENRRLKTAAPTDERTGSIHGRQRNRKSAGYPSYSPQFFTLCRNALNLNRFYFRANIAALLD